MKRSAAAGAVALALLHSKGVKAQDPNVTTTRSAIAARRSDDSNGAHIESLLDLANEFISSAYPSSTITDVASLAWPESVVIGTSTVDVPDELVTRTTRTTSANSSTRATSSTSTSEPIAAPTTEREDSSGDNDPNLGMILGVVFGILAFLLILFAICLLWRRRSRKRRARPNTPSDDGVEALTVPAGNKEWPERYTNRPAPLPPPRSASPQFNRYSADDEILTNPFNQPVSELEAIHPAHRVVSTTQTRDFATLHYAPHHYTPPSSVPLPVTQYPYQSGITNRDSGYYGHSTENQVIQPPSTYSARYQSYQGHSTENPFTSPAYNVQSQSQTSINRRPVPKDSASSLSRSSGTRSSLHVVSEEESSSGSSACTPGTPYLPPRSPKRKSGSTVYYPPPSEASDFNFGFEGPHSFLSYEGSNITTCSGPLARQS